MTCYDRVKTVSKLLSLEVLELASSEKQIPQIVEKTESVENRKNRWKPTVMRPRQMLYPPELRAQVDFSRDRASSQSPCGKVEKEG
jgi:hypothetical protein